MSQKGGRGRGILERGILERGACYKNQLPNRGLIREEVNSERGRRGLIKLL